MGWGSVLIGLCLLCPGILEIASGTFSPVGYSSRSSWIKTLLSTFFGASGPIVSALIWFALGIGFIWFGLKHIRAPKP